jgi:hypothetical protein
MAVVAVVAVEESARMQTVTATAQVCLSVCSAVVHTMVRLLELRLLEPIAWAF